MCYYCANGLPKPVQVIFDELEARCPNFEYGPGHIVFDDFNFEDENIDWCLNEWIENYKSYLDRFTPDQMESTRVALERLKTIPLAIRIPPEVEKWDDQHG